jgi:hypothetical protein
MHVLLLVLSPVHANGAMSYESEDARLELSDAGFPEIDDSGRQRRVRGRYVEGHAGLGSDQGRAARRQGGPCSLGRSEHDRPCAQGHHAAVRSSPQWPAIQEKVSKKAIIQAFGDQDGTNASYIKPEWPGIEFRQMLPPEYAPYRTGSAECLDISVVKIVFLNTQISTEGHINVI